MSEHSVENAAALALAMRILAPGDDDNVTLGELRREYGITDARCSPAAPTAVQERPV
jgi:hypothetical protein